MTRAAGLSLLAVLVLAGCGSEGRDSSAKFDPFTKVRDRSTEHPERASPRWEPITTLSGSGPARRTFTVARGAIQWRAQWWCEKGALKLIGVSGSAQRTLVDSGCPRRGTSTDVRTGTRDLHVQASGRWRVVLEQQVDTPLREPPLRAMQSRAAQLIARGRFYPLERDGRGTASLYRLADRQLALRLEHFATSANTDLFVWLSSASKPRNTIEAARSRHVVLYALKSTVGEQNYVLPAKLRAEQIRSIVIWCVPVRIAYTAASLNRT